MKGKTQTINTFHFYCVFLQAVLQFYQNPSLQSNVHFWLTGAQISPAAWTFCWELMGPTKVQQILKNISSKISPVMSKFVFVFFFCSVVFNSILFKIKEYIMFIFHTLSKGQFLMVLNEQLCENNIFYGCFSSFILIKPVQHY